MSEGKDPYDLMIEDMKKDKEKGAARKFWNFPSQEEGTKTIRFLPHFVKNGEKFFYYKHKTHWIDGKSYECLDQNTPGHVAEYCPVCKYVQKLYKVAEKDSDDFKLAGDLRAKERYVSRIILRGSEDETVPMFYEYGVTIFDMLFNVIAESDFGNITHPMNGRDYKLTKTGKGRNCKYSSSTPSAKETPIFAERDKIALALKNAEKMSYTELFQYTGAEEMDSTLKEFLNGGEEEEEPAPVRAPAKPTAAPTRATSAKVERAMEEEEVSESENEDEDDLDDILKQFDV